VSSSTEAGDSNTQDGGVAQADTDVSAENAPSSAELGSVLAEVISGSAVGITMPESDQVPANVAAIST
jgi:hypothetical protein